MIALSPLVTLALVLASSPPPPLSSFTVGIAEPEAVHAPGHEFRFPRLVLDSTGRPWVSCVNGISVRERNHWVHREWTGRDFRYPKIAAGIDGTVMLTGDQKLYRATSLDDGIRIAEVPVTYEEPELAPRRPPTSLAVGPDGAIWMSATNDGLACLWRIEDGIARVVLRRTEHQWIGPSSPKSGFWRVAVQPSGRVWMSASLFDRATSRPDDLGVAPSTWSALEGRTKSAPRYQLYSFDGTTWRGHGRDTRSLRGSLEPEPGGALRIRSSTGIHARISAEGDIERIERRSREISSSIEAHYAMRGEEGRSWWIHNGILHRRVGDAVTKISLEWRGEPVALTGAEAILEDRFGSLWIHPRAGELIRVRPRISEEL